MKQYLKTVNEALKYVAGLSWVTDDNSWIGWKTDEGRVCIYDTLTKKLYKELYYQNKSTIPLSSRIIYCLPNFKDVL